MFRTVTRSVTHLQTTMRALAVRRFHVSTADDLKRIQYGYRLKHLEDLKRQAEAQRLEREMLLQLPGATKLHEQAKNDALDMVKDIAKAMFNGQTCGVIKLKDGATKDLRNAYHYRNGAYVREVYGKTLSTAIKEKMHASGHPKFQMTIVEKTKPSTTIFGNPVFEIGGYQRVESESYVVEWAAEDEHQWSLFWCPDYE